MAKTFLLGFFAAALPVLSAQAAPATPEEAARLTTLFERFAAHPDAGQPSGVTVVPQGDAYRVTLDLAHALSGLGGLHFSVDPNVSTALLTPQSDGTWAVSGAESPPLVIHAGQQTITLKAATSKFDGIYDPKLFAFKETTQIQTGYVLDQDAPNLTQERRVDRAAVTTKAVPDAAGTVSVAGHTVDTGTAADLLIKPPPAPAPGPADAGNSAEAGNPAVPPPLEPSTPITYAMPTTTIDFGIDGLHTKELLDLWALLVAHPNHDSLATAQDELRGTLRAALPVLSALRETLAIEKLSVTSPSGVVSAQNVGAGLDLAGLAGTGKASTSFSFDGLTVPSQNLPAWTQDLVPTALSLAIGVDGFHAAEAASEAVNDFDLKADKPFTPEQNEKIGHLFWPAAGGTLTLSPSRLTSKLLDLTFEGQAMLTSPPSGQMTVSATGLDKAIAVLQASAGTDPLAAQVLGPMVLAKNLAKPNADGSLGWVIDASHGPLLVNGAPLQ